MTEIIIKLTKIELKGKFCVWDVEDAGFKKYAGSIYFENNNYQGFLKHNGTVDLLRNGRVYGNHKPSNFVIC